MRACIAAIALVACTKAPPRSSQMPKVIDARPVFDGAVDAVSIDARVAAQANIDPCEIPDPPHASLMPLDPALYAQKDEAWQLAVTVCLRAHFVDAP